MNNDFKNLYYSNLRTSDIANGTGVRVSLFVSGCPHHCKGCFNKETWTYKAGVLFTNTTMENIIKHLELPYIEGFTLIGGEPLAPLNQPGVLEILRVLKRDLKNLKNIWIYTGYTYETLPQTEYMEDILSYTDILVDGPFIEDLKDISLKFRGSSNQRIIDIQKTKRTGIMSLKNL